MFNFIIMNSIAGLTVYLFTKYLFIFEDYIDKILAIFVLFCSQVVLTELTLGIFGKLYLYNLIFINLLILIIVSLWIKFKGLDLPKKQNPQTYPGLWLIQNKPAIFCLAIISGFTIIKLINNITNPPLGWDSLNYHFTFPVEWLKHGNLINPITICDDPTPTYYPINNGLFYLWLIYPFKSVFLANLGQIPFFVFSLLAVYNISQKIGLSKEFSFFSAVIFAVIPNYFRQIEFAYADIMVASLFLISLNFLINLNHNFKFTNLVISSMALGLLLGTKTVSLPYALILLFFLVYIIATKPKAEKASKIITYCAVLILSLFALSSFSYIRNSILTNNPLYPFDFEIFGKTIFKGVMAASTYKAHWSQKDYNISKLLFHEGMGVQFILLFIPGVLLALPVTFLKEKRIRFELLYILILPVLLYFAFRYIIPQLWSRFLYPFLGVSSVVSFYTAQKLNIPKKIIYTIVIICFLASIPEMARHLQLILALLLSAIIFLSIPFCLKIIISKKINLVHLALIIIILLAAIRISWANYQKEEYPRYVTNTRFWPEATLAWKWLHDNIDHGKIAYTGRPVPFPLYGTNFRNDVFYVSINGTQPQLHNYKNGHLTWNEDFHSIHAVLAQKGNYRSDPDYKIWRKNLTDKNADYIFIYVLHETSDFPIEDQWAKSNPANFKPVFLNEGVHIYKIIR